MFHVLQVLFPTKSVKRCLHLRIGVSITKEERVGLTE